MDLGVPCRPFKLDLNMGTYKSYAMCSETMPQSRFTFRSVKPLLTNELSHIVIICLDKSISILGASEVTSVFYFI